MNTPHQKRSCETFHNQDVQSQLFYPAEKNWIRKKLQSQVRALGIWQISNYIKAKTDKQLGGKGMMRSVTFDN